MKKLGLIGLLIILSGLVIGLACRLPATTDPDDLRDNQTDTDVSSSPISTVENIENTLTAPVWQSPSISVPEQATLPITPEGVLTLAPTNTPDSIGTAVSTIQPAEAALQSIRLAVIGDYGTAGPALTDVANLINSWQPDYILTTGDNNYPTGSYASIDENIGQYFHDYIAPYKGTYGAGADVNRFYPTLGNHDYDTDNAQPYFEYFTLPGNERYYDIVLGPVHIFAMNSDWREQDGVGRSSAQAAWLKEKLATSTSAWKLVVFHAAPYSSGMQGSTDWMRWPFREWGASAVLAGHDHVYERLLIDGLPYFTNGLGGGAIYRFEEIHPGSQVRYNADYGAMLIVADGTDIVFQFINRDYEVIDTYQISR